MARSKKEIMEECSKRNAKEKDHPTCKRCEEDYDTLNMGHIMDSPEKCPHADKMRDFAKPFSMSLEVSQGIAKALDLSKQVNTISQVIKSVSLPKISSDMFSGISRAFEEIQKQQSVFHEIIKKNNWSNILGGIELSPILKSIDLIPRVKINKDEERFEVDAPKEELEEYLEDVEKEEDAIYNWEAYKFLFKLETFLRALITERIIEPHSRDLGSKINPAIIQEWEQRQKTEVENEWCENGEYELIEYSDFNDLYEVFNKGKNKKLFADLVSEENFKIILAKLRELDPIRKKIAHSRLIKKKELERVKDYKEKIEKAFGR